jgi:hypothetical protein
MLKASNANAVWLCVAITVLALAPLNTSVANALEIDFDTFDDLDGFDQHSGSFVGVFHGSNAGVGNTGGLSPGSKVELTYSEGTFSLNEPVTVSSYFRTSSGTGVFASPYEMASVYVSTSIDGRPSVSTYANISAKIERDFANQTDVLYGSMNVPGQLWFDESIDLGYTLSPNTWYELILKLERGSGLLNRTIELRNHGSTGLTQPGSLVESTTTGYLGENVISNDSTLYAGFGARNGLVSGLDNFRLEAAGIDPPTESVLITPTFDAQRSPSSNYPLGALTQTTLDIDGGSGTGYPALQVLTEFSLEQVPANAEILSAQLYLDPTTSSSSIVLMAMGYEGDGLASLSDPGASVTEFGRKAGPFTSTSDILIDLDPTKVQQVHGASSHLGLLLVSQNAGPYIRIASSESTTGVGPRLIIEYALPETVPGDYNSDGVVDAADYTVWRDALGSSVAAFAGADGNGDGAVNEADHAVWAEHYGATLDGESATATPEPTTLLLALMTFASLHCRVQRRL